MDNVVDENSEGYLYVVGPQGPKGDKGDPGKSAYEVAVDNGYEGTESEWVQEFLTPDGYYTKAEIDTKETLLQSSISTVSNNLLNETHLRENVTGDLQAQIDALSNGSPLAVADVSGMTDISKIYVNANDGYWYYYNGATWTAGGMYVAADLVGNSWRGIFKKRIYPDTHVLAKGGWQASDGAATSTANRFKNYVYIRNCVVLKNPDSGYKLILHKYTVNSSVQYSHVNNDSVYINDNNYHYINFLNCDYFRVIVVDVNGSTIPSANYKTIFNNLEFYVPDEEEIVPEELIGGGISVLTDTSNAGKLLRKTDDYNLSHYIINPIYATKDTIVDIVFKARKTKQDANFGVQLYIYNSDKYVVQSMLSIRKNLSLLLKEGYYLAIVAYGYNDARFDRFDINDYLEIKQREPELYLSTMYKVPGILQHQRWLKYEYGSGFTCEGLTSDDDYLYVSGNVNGIDNKCKIFKIEIADNTNIISTGERAYGHANGIAKAGDKIAITQLSRGNLNFVNASDLSDAGSCNAVDLLAQNGFKLGAVSSLAYNNKYQKYCLYGPKYREGEDPDISNPTFLPKHFVITDNDFNIVKDIEIISPKNITSPIPGGCHMFDNMIALTVWNDAAHPETNKVLLFNWDGDLITYLDVPYTQEIEAVTCVGDDYYLLFNSGYQGFSIYKLKSMAFRLMTDKDLINDFESISSNMYSDIGIATNTYNHLYNEITDTAGTVPPADWF